MRIESKIMQDWKYDISTPLVSICCTTYNHENYIAEAIEGFLIQETDFPFEILIRDDFSTDKTAKIVQEYAQKYPLIIHPIYEEENTYSKGIRPMQELFKIAKGKYIALCEGDDYWTDSLKLQKQVDFLEANLDYGLVCTDMVKYNQKEDKYEESNIVPLKKGSFEELIHWKNQVWVLTVCFRKSLLDNRPILDFNIYFGGDIFLFLHIAQQSKLKFMPDKTAVYRILEESASHFKDKMKAIEFTYKVSNTMLYYLDKHQISYEVYKSVFYKNMLARFKYARANRNFDIFKTVKLDLPSNSNLKILGLQLLYILCKWRPFFQAYTSFSKQIIGKC